MECWDFFVEGKKRRELDIKEKNTQGGQEWDDMMKAEEKKRGGGAVEKYT